MKRLFRLVYLNLLIFACLASIAILSILFFYQTEQVITTDQWVTHTQETMINGYNILNDEQLIILAAQRFIATGDLTYLTSYKKTKLSLYADFSILKNLTRDNLLQQNRLIQLKKLMEQQINIINFLINVRNNNTLQTHK